MLYEIFEKPDGPIALDRNGKWWCTRESTGTDTNGNITVCLADGVHVVRITGTPTMLDRVAMAITAQVLGAVANDNPNRTV